MVKNPQVAMTSFFLNILNIKKSSTPIIFNLTIEPEISVDFVLAPTLVQSRKLNTKLFF